jgi:hypothetical protein
MVQYIRFQIFIVVKMAIVVYTEDGSYTILWSIGKHHKNT